MPISDCSVLHGVNLNFFFLITLVHVHLNWLNLFDLLILVAGPIIILIGCMIFLSPFLDVMFNSQGFIQALLLTSAFHEGLSFMAVAHNPTCISTLAPCSWGFILGPVRPPCEVQGQCPWKPCYFTDPRFSHSLSMHHLVTQSFPFFGTLFTFVRLA